MSHSVELELDDCTYVLDFQYEKYRPATRWEPAEGGDVMVDRLTMIVDGYDGPIEVDMTAHWGNLKVTDQLRDLAKAEARMIA